MSQLYVMVVRRRELVGATNVDTNNRKVPYHFSVLFDNWGILIWPKNVT